MAAHPVSLGSSPKAPGLDKARPPEETWARVTGRLARCGLDIFAGVRRVDAGRLGIPVYMSMCGADALKSLPARKQMGKGENPAQARASALMELMERYAFFSFFERREGFVRATWSEAEARFGEALIPLREMAASVNDQTARAREILDLRAWDFYPATRLGDGQTVWLPLDWFRLLGEFNGSSAGNTAEESILQGLCELAERHLCARIDRARPQTPTIDPASFDDAVLRELAAAFERQGIFLLLKDFSQDFPLPCVAALAHDPATFPQKSEIVFTAGVATSPTRAAIRALTEVAQLGGDFCTGSCYEASGLPKFAARADYAWLLAGEKTTLASLPDISAGDLGSEARAVARKFPVNVYAVETTHPLLGIPAHYCMAPGLEFRERDRNQSLGLFTGRKLAEEGDANGLRRLAALCPNAHYLPFFAGLLAIGQGDPRQAAALFAQAAPAQPDDEARALALFYLGYAKTLLEDWPGALEPLAEAFALCPAREYGNLLGVAHYRQKDYAEAERIFDQVLKLDKGSSMDLANRGVCRKFLGRREAARADLEEALRLDPSLDFVRRHLEDL